jgi:hypothetical protein
MTGAEPLSARAAGVALRLAQWPRQRVRLVELWRIFDEVDPASRTDARRRGLLADTLAELAEAGRLRLPGSRSFDRTERPPLPRFVSLSSDLPAAAPTRPVVWHPHLAWAPDTRLTPAQRTVLEQVNRWLHSQRDPLVVPMRERSVEIFGHEKTLERLVATGLFAPGRLTLDLLRCRRVAPRFVIEPVGPGDLLLVVENSDTFDSLVRALRETTGHRVGSVGWGAGTAFEASVLSVPRESVAEVRYFGDLDEKGLQVPTNAAALARREGLPPPRPATGLYAALLRLAVPQPGQRKVPLVAAGPLTVWLAPEHRDRAAALLLAGERLAQEAVGLAYLLRYRDWLAELECRPDAAAG